MRISDWSSDVCSSDLSKATVKVRVGFKTRDARILPEMGARVSFLAEASDDKTQSGAAPSGVSLPDTAVQSEGAGSATGVVFVLHDDVVERRAVKLGAQTGTEQIPVLSGVKAGQPGP